MGPSALECSLSYPAVQAPADGPLFKANEMKDKWDIFDIVQAVPGANESLELIQPTQAENPCKMA